MNSRVSELPLYFGERFASQHLISLIYLMLDIYKLLIFLRNEQLGCEANHSSLLSAEVKMHFPVHLYGVILN